MRRLLVTAVFALAGACAGIAQADTVTARFVDVTPNQAVDYELGQPGGPKGATLAGVFRWQKVSGGTEIKGGSVFSSFCIEMTQHVSFNTVFDYELVDLADAPKPGDYVANGPGMGVAKATAISELWGRYFNLIGSDASLARAFQVSVWEIVYDFNALLPGNGLSVSSGVFKSVNDTSLAQTWLSSLDGTGPMARLAAISSGGVSGAQDQVVELVGPSNAPPVVPLPSSVLAGGAILGILGCKSLRRK